MNQPELRESSLLHSYAKRWVWLGVAALAVAGVFAVLLVAARAPQLKAIGLSQDLFNMALVVHVDLSVLVWFLAVIGAYLSVQLHNQTMRWLYAEPAAFWSFAAGALFMTLSPLEGEWAVVKSNYIPVLINPLFFLGLSLLAAGMLVLTAEVIGTNLRMGALSMKNAVGVVMAWVVLAALGFFAHSGATLPDGYDAEGRFEYLFWAGGHTLQFAFTLMAIIAWAKLYASRYSVEPFTRMVWGAMLLATVVGIVAPLPAVLEYPVDSAEFQGAFTRAMIEWGGFAGTVALLAIGWRICSAPKLAMKRDARFSTLVTSLVLFVAGGVLGLMITGQNVTIPAHYHGAIVSVTLALMGYAYTLMPKFGYGDVSQWKLAFWQPIIYGIGQLMHVGGLAYSGGYGVLRKTAVGNTEFAPEIKAALGVMGLGGLLAIIGGLLFVVVMVKSYRAVRA